MSTDIKERARRILTGSEGTKPVVDGIYILPAQGNALAVETGDGVLYTGAAFPGSTISNIGTPLRTLRFTIRWAESCELTASLDPAAPAAAAAAVRAAIADPEAVLHEVEALRERGEVQLALHVIDLLALSDADDDITRRARTLKSQLCRLCAEQVRPYVSKALYETSAQLLERGSTSWTTLERDGAQ